MRLGGRRQIIVPPNLAYGLTDVTRNGAVVVPSNSVLVFDVTLTVAAGSSVSAVANARSGRSLVQVTPWRSDSSSSQ